jgi:hypothetical protein
MWVLVNDGRLVCSVSSELGEEVIVVKSSMRSFVVRRVVKDM